MDFGPNGKFKRSRVVSDYNRMRLSQQAEAKARAEATKQVEAYRSHLKKLGIDHEAFEKSPEEQLVAYSRKYLQQQIEEAQLDPKEIEHRKREAELQAREAKAAEFEKQQKESHETAQVDARANEFATSITEALEQSSLPRNPKTIARMAELMLAAARNGRQLPPHELAQRVAAQIFDEQSHHLSSFSGDGAAIAKWLGPENLEAVRKHILGEAQSKFNQPKQQTQRAPSNKLKILTNPKHVNGYIGYDEMLAASKKLGR